MLKSSLLFKKNANFTGIKLANSGYCSRIKKARFSGCCFYVNGNI